MRGDLCAQLGAADKAGRATVREVVFKRSDGKLGHREAVKVGITRLVVKRRLAFWITVEVTSRACQAVELAFDSIGHPVARRRWQYVAHGAQSELKALALTGCHMVIHELRVVAEDDLRPIDEDRTA